MHMAHHKSNIYMLMLNWAFLGTDLVALVRGSHSGEFTSVTPPYTVDQFLQLQH